MADDVNKGSMGRKVFFLHPSAFMLNAQIIDELAQEEFEVYIIKDEAKIRQALELYPDSILFASINEALKENVWIDLIRDIHNNPITAAVDIAFLASTSDELVKQKYTGLFDFNCGYTVVKSDVEKATKEIVAILNKVNAKGRRKFIRLVTDKENTTVNIPINAAFKNGNIKDISIVGFSCTFAEDPVLPKNGLYGNIQIKLQGQLLKAEAIVFGSRMDGDEKVYVFLFTKRMDPSIQAKIRKYIQTKLQSKMDEELK